MFVASDEATCGSVIAKADRMGPASRGRSPGPRWAPALPLGLTAELGEHLHVAGVRGGAVQRGRGDRRAAAGELGERGVLQIGQAGAVLAGQEEVPQPGRAGPGLQARDDRWRGPVAGVLLVEGGLGGIDVLVQKGEQPLAVVLGLGVEREVHQFPSSVPSSDSCPWATNGATSAPTVSKPSPTVWP